MCTEQKPTISKYRDKSYKCQKCGYEKQIGTNHFGQCYSLGSYNCCPKCSPMDITTWECQEPCPDNMQKPAPWKTVKLGDVCEIIQGVKIPDHLIIKKKK